MITCYNNNMETRKCIPLPTMEGRIIEDPEEAYIPNITSTEATKAPYCMVKEDIEKNYILLCKFFNELKEGTPTKYTMLYNILTYSVDNFVWLATFTKELETLYGKLGNEICDIEIPYDLLPTKKSKEALYWYPPTELLTLRGNKYKVLYKRAKTRVKYNIIKLNRLLYIKNNYEGSDFYDGFPEWYRIRDGIEVFNKYCRNISKRIRIVYIDNEYRYYIAGASDNWQEIQGAPIEIDDVVTALLFRD